MPVGLAAAPTTVVSTGGVPVVSGGSITGGASGGFFAQLAKTIAILSTRQAIEKLDLFRINLLERKKDMQLVWHKIAVVNKPGRYFTFLPGSPDSGNTSLSWVISTNIKMTG